uniref:Fibronectin type-III domain-containing protein n=1 Tax=Gasterosteus aculeatus aculeatus TaxID=481459 RepID=A0AAQ4Q4Z8_GASAC
MRSSLFLGLLGLFVVSLFPQPAQGQVSSPRRFRAKILSPTRLHVSWKEPKGQFESYKVVYSTRPGGEQKEVEVSKQDAKLLIDDFDPSKEYNFKVVALSGGQQSKPLQATHEAQQSGVEVVRSPRRQDAREDNDISEGGDVMSGTSETCPSSLMKTAGVQSPRGDQRLEPRCLAQRLRWRECSPCR